LISPAPLFRDRAEAGALLARAIEARLSEYARECQRSPETVIFALPRGGLPIAAPVARRLGCPLDIVVAKKIVRAYNPELALGAVSADGHVLWARRWRKSPWKQAAVAAAREKARAQYESMAGVRGSTNLAGAIAIVVDDGIATGMTISVAARALRSRDPAQVWICAPVAPADLEAYLQRWCDRTVILATPEEFSSVSRFYAEFPQVSLEEAIAILQEF
jgi:predicted phosphoribosyltransferase